MTGHSEIDPATGKRSVSGFAIGVIQDDRLVYAQGFGVKNLAHNHDPVTPRSLFHMASITKTFVATSIMQLVEPGKINLDTPVVQYLPYFRLADHRYQTITVRQMVTHTSGMPDVMHVHHDPNVFRRSTGDSYGRDYIGDSYSLIERVGE